MKTDFSTSKEVLMAFELYHNLILNLFCRRLVKVSKTDLSLLGIPLLEQIYEYCLGFMYINTHTIYMYIINNVSIL